MHSRFDVCVLIVLSELICYCEQSCFVLLNVFGIILFFGRRGVVLRRCLCWFRFPPSVFFWKEVFVIGISRASVWLFGFGVVYFFRKERCCFATCFCCFRFPPFVFFLGGVEDVFVIGISRVSVWPFGFGII